MPGRSLVRSICAPEELGQEVSFYTELLPKASAVYERQLKLELHISTLVILTLSITRTKRARTGTRRLTPTRRCP